MEQEMAAVEAKDVGIDMDIDGGNNTGSNGVNVTVVRSASASLAQTDGDRDTQNELGQSNVININDNSDLTTRSKKILSTMDSDNDGIVTYSDAANYGKKMNSKTTQWKWLFIIQTILLF